MTNSKVKKASTYAASQRDHGSNEQTGALQPIFAKAKILHDLTQKLNAHLDKTLKNNCHITNIDRQTITILTNSGSHATQLRYQVPDLLRKFKTDPSLSRFTAIQVINRPAISTPAPRRLKKINRLSKDTALLMQNIADGCEDETLKEALLRIAKNVE